MNGKEFVAGLNNEQRAYLKENLLWTSLIGECEWQDEVMAEMGINVDIVNDIAYGNIEEINDCFKKYGVNREYKIGGS